MGRWCGSPPQTCRSPSARRSNARSFLRSRTSRRRAVSSSPTSATTVEVTMPQMGVSVAEGTIVAWKKEPGDQVEADEPIVEISTDKVETEVPAPASGRLRDVLVSVGETVDVGTVLATIEVGGDGRPAEEKPEPALHMESPYREEAPPEAAPAAAEAAPTVAEAATRPAEAAPTAAEAAPRPAEAAPPPDGGPVPQELSVMRKRIAEHMVRSVQTAAHCTTIVDADMSRIDAVRGKRSYLPFVARATIAALREHPTLNATIEGDRLTVHDAVHLGIAVSLGEEGLIVPVIRNAHELSEEGLAVRIKDLAVRARAKRLSPDDVGGGTFTITNPGAFGALLATPIINQPQVAILDLEAVVKRPVVVTDADGSDSIAIRPMTYLCMSWDHRALDGALAAQFLSTLKRRIESWSGS